MLIVMIDELQQYHVKILEPFGHIGRNKKDKIMYMVKKRI